MIENHKILDNLYNNEVWIISLKVLKVRTKTVKNIVNYYAI